jgi:beta-glucosidase
MENRTYRYFSGTPLYPFGYGLSYTTFSYTDLTLPEKIDAGSDAKVSVRVTNSGKMAGDEVVQLYITDEKASTPRPLRQLEGFKRVHLDAGESKTVEFTLKAEQFSMINKNDVRVIEPGWFTVAVGGGQPGLTGTSDSRGTQVLSSRIRLTGKEIRLNE